MHFCASSCGLTISQCDSEPLLAGGGTIVVPYVRLFLRQVPRGENTHQVPWENTLQILREIWLPSQASALGNNTSTTFGLGIGRKRKGFILFFVSTKKVDNTYDMTHAIQAWLSPKQTDTLSLHIICKPTQTMQLPQLRFLKWLAYLVERLEGTLLWFW